MNRAESVISIFSLACLVGFCAIASHAQQKPSGQSGETERVKKLEERVAAMADLVDILLRDDPPAMAWLDCTDKNFREVRLTGSALSVFVACDTIEPYLEGHRVKLRIGNPYAFDFLGLKGFLWHGQERLETLNSQRKTEISSTQRLRSGTWLPVEVAINPSKPSEFREIGVTLSIETVSPVQLSP